MKFRILVGLVFVLGTVRVWAAEACHVWEKQELVFTAQHPQANAYISEDVWIDLTGPGFAKRVYGFWDGGETFRIRFAPTQPGHWHWVAGSSSNDPGLQGQGELEATAWPEEAKIANPNRRGMIRPTSNAHALEYADGTPFFAVGDTWFALGTNRMPWYDDDQARPIGPDAGFKDYVRLRQSQGYNWVGMIATFANWNTDGQPYHFFMNDAEHTPFRFAWLEFGTGSAKNMDNEGGKPFLFPGKISGYENLFPDVDRINPEYFKAIDRKIDYLNAHGFVPFIEVARRDVSLPWKRHLGWPDSYARLVQYIWTRYQANVAVFAPVHLDILQETVPPADYDAVVDLIKKRYGLPPFGTLLSSNANPSTLVNWGEPSWVTLHQMGNKREHENYWYLTDIYYHEPHRPALNGEPYYSGYKDKRGLGGSGYKYGAEGGTETDARYCRSAMYGSFLSGGLAGHVYGAEGIWGSDREASAPTKMWDAFGWSSGAQMHLLRDFAFSLGKTYQQLEPMPDLISPSRDRRVKGYSGWSYCARTPDKDNFLLYFEGDAVAGQLRGAKLNARYRAQWFNPRDGKWIDVSGGYLTSNEVGIIQLPPFPDARVLNYVPLSWIPERYHDMLARHEFSFTSDVDWGMRLVFDRQTEKSAY